MRLRWACVHVCVCARVHRHTHTSLDLGFLCTKFRFLARIISRWTWPHGDVDYMYELALRARAAEGGACGMVWGHVSFWEGRRPRGGRRRGEPPAAAASPSMPAADGARPRPHLDELRGAQTLLPNEDFSPQLR